MPQVDNSRGGQTRARRVARKPKPNPTTNTTPRVYSRSDAAQREGATTGRRKNKTPHFNSRSDAAQRQGATSRYVGPSEKQRKRLRKARPIGDKPYTDRERADVEQFKRDSDEYFLARDAARRARYRDASPAEKKRLFGNPREDAKDPEKLAAFKAYDDRLADIRRRRLRRAVDKELSGDGTIAKFFRRAGKNVGASSTVIATGVGPYGKTSTATAKAPKIISRAAEDAVNFPAQAVPSLYVPAAGVVEAAQGRPERLERYVEDVKQTDPIYNTVAAGVEAARGNSKAAKSHLAKAEKSAIEHPGFTALEVVGTKGTAGRGAGAVMRSGVVGKRAKRAASIKREPARVPGTGLVQKREFSRDVTTKMVQARRERGKIRKADKTRARARNEVDPDRRVELEAQANRQDPRIASGREIRTRVDERVAANEDVRRIHRSDVQDKTQAITRKVRRKDRPAISVVAQRIVRADKDDLRAYIGELKDEHPRLDAAGKRANERLRRDLQGIVDDPKADLGKVAQAADEYAALTNPMQGKLVKRGLLAADQAEKAKLVPYAVRRMHAKHDKQLGLVDADGLPLSAAEVRLHMAANGEPDAAFISQAPNQRGARNYNIRSERAQTIQGRRRTGEATRGGTFDADPETLQENSARAQGLVDATDGFRGFLGEMAARKDNGHIQGFLTRSGPKGADQTARNLEAATGMKFRPVRINPFGASRQQLQSLLDDVASDAQLASRGHGEKSPVVKAIEEAIQGAGGDDGPWALIPEQAATRLQQHLNTMTSTGEFGKTLGMLNSNFRKTVLSTSPTWVTGNVVEGAFRTALMRAGPTSYMTGRKALKALKDEDLQLAEEVAVRTIGGGNFGSAERQHIRRGADQFTGTSLESIGNGLGKFWRAPGPKQAADLWHGYTQFVFENMRRLESQFQTAMLGKAIRQSEIFDDKLVGLSDAAMRDVVNGLKDTNNVVALGRTVDRAYGKYAKDAPAMRMAKAYYTPFISWYLNAVKFVVDVLPRDHPTVTALIAQAEIATDEWRKDHGLDLFMDRAVPGWLQGAIPTDAAGGKQRAPHRYLPFGAFGDPLATASGQMLPQFMGPIFAASGLDWTGSPLEGPGGSTPDQGDKAKAVAQTFLGGQIPALALSLRVADSGAQALNPIRETPGWKPDQAKSRRARKRVTGADIVRGRGGSSSSAGGTDWSLDTGSGGNSGGGGVDWSIR